MIDDDQELAITQKQLALVDGIVDSWRKRLLPHNPKNFALYAEGAIEQADILRAEINEYLGRRKLRPSETPLPQATAGASAHDRFLEGPMHNVPKR